MTREKTIQKRDIIVTQFINELGITIETNTKPLIHCKECKHYSVEGETTRFGWCGYWNKPTDEMRYCSDGERSEL